MEIISEPTMLVEDLSDEQLLVLSGASVEDSGHCKYCNNGSNYCN